MIRLTVPDGLVEARRFCYDFVPTDGEGVLDAELVASADHTTVRLAASLANWLEVSTDGGTIYTPLGVNVQAGLDVGPMLTGARLPIKLKVVPQANFRQRRIGVLVGTGV